jgi:predicted transcriptional regulator
MSEELLIRDIMSKPVTIAKSAAITEALDKMLSEAVDPLIVVNNGSVVGTISRRTIAETLGSKKNSGLSPPQFMCQIQWKKILQQYIPTRTSMCWYRFSSITNLWWSMTKITG